MRDRKGQHWTRAEVEAIVNDYLDMLLIELGGGTVVKAERNRALQELIRRSKGSIEYKHQNISAVMAEFGLPFINGYKPARNYQQILFEIVDAHLCARGLHDYLASGLHDRVANRASMGLAAPAELKYQSAPSLNASDVAKDPNIARILSRHDPATRDARAHALGKAGEALVFEAERKRLSLSGRDDLAAKVRWVAKEDGDGAGFDILSFSCGGAERWLEVKTTNGPATTPFWISENERRVSVRNPNEFRLTRLFDFAIQPKAFLLRPPLTDHVRLHPTQYRATF